MNFCFVFVILACMSGVFGICTIDETKSLIDQIRTKLWLVEQLVDKESEMCKENQEQAKCPTQPTPTTHETTTTTEPTTTTTEPTTTTTTATITTVPECEEDGKEFNGHCYYLSKGGLNWESANNACKEKNAHLPIVETEEENTFLRDWARNEGVSIWLDGSDDLVEGIWLWTSTGEPFTFTAWRAGDPDGARSQNCLVIHSNYSYKWIDSSCKSNDYNYVCEFEN